MFWDRPGSSVDVKFDDEKVDESVGEWADPLKRGQRSPGRSALLQLLATRLEQHEQVLAAIATKTILFIRKT
jgi:hypothetical protein